MITICIATFGSDEYRDLAWSRAYPSTIGQGAQVVINHEPEGTCASARNMAAKQAAGDWLVYLDCDDELAPGYIEAMQNAANGPAMYLPQTAFARHGRPKPAHFLPSCSLRDGNPMIIGTMVPRKQFLQVGGFTEGVELFEDWMLFAQLWKNGLQVIQVPDAVYVAHMVRNSRNRITHGKTRLYWHQFIGHSVFPEHYEPTLPEEDTTRRLSTSQIRVIA